MTRFLLKPARQARNSLLFALRESGLLRLAANSKWRHNRLLILCYHGVSLADEHEWDPELFVTRAFLRRRLELLRDGGYNVLGLADALQKSGEGRLPPKSVVLTFDDGLSDFAQVVAPMLLEFGYRATVYVTTYYVDKQWPVAPPIFNYLLWKAGDSLLELDWPEFGIRSLPGYDLNEARRRALVGITKRIEERELSGESRNQLVLDAARRLRVDLTEVMAKRILHLMTPAEVASVAEAGFDVQLHTHRHRMPRTFLEFEKEIIENRDRLSNITGLISDHFCYPSGIVFPECLPWLKRLGVRSGATCEPGLCSPSQDRLLLPRFVDGMLQSETNFLTWLSGAGTAFRSGRRLEVNF